MFCPRCGRTVSETANFCGGCGLPKAEILKYHRAQMSTPVITPVQEIPPVNEDELENTISQLENRLKNEDASSTTDYTTETTDDTNTIEDVFTPSDFIRQEIKAEQQAAEYSRPQYSYSVPEYTYGDEEEEPQQSAGKTSVIVETDDDFTLSTVDYIWMMIISAVPVVGMIYLLYNAFAAENPNKRSFARAVLIISIFGSMLAAVFGMGLVMSQLLFW